MVYASYKSIFAMMAMMNLNSVDAIGCNYAPWGNRTVTGESITTELQLMSQYFSSVRTFESRMSGFNAIDLAAAAKIKIAVGVQMNDMSQVDAEIQAVCEGYNRNKDAVISITVGNEILQNGDFGKVSAEQLVGYINQVKKCTGNSVPVGTVQRINEWLSAPGIASVAEACDTIGVNIYAFFSVGNQSPMEKVSLQWQQMLAKYDAKKLQLTETGWPTDGGSAFGNTASVETLQQFLIDFAVWAVDKNECYWFMCIDNSNSYTKAEYEKHFGLFRQDLQLKVEIPGAFKTITKIQGGPPSTDPIQQTELGEPMMRNPDGSIATPPFSNNSTPPTVGDVEQHDGSTPPTVGDVEQNDNTPSPPMTELGEPMMRNPDGSIITPSPAGSGSPPTVGGANTPSPVPTTPTTMVGEPLMPIPAPTPVDNNGPPTVGGANSPSPPSITPMFELGDPVSFNPDGSFATPPAIVYPSDNNPKKDCPM